MNVICGIHKILFIYLLLNITFKKIGGTPWKLNEIKQLKPTKGHSETKECRLANVKNKC